MVQASDLVRAFSDQPNMEREQWWRKVYRLIVKIYEVYQGI
jgi:hypothetical protein